MIQSTHESTDYYRPDEETRFRRRVANIELTTAALKATSRAMNKVGKHSYKLILYTGKATTSLTRHATHITRSVGRYFKPRSSDNNANKLFNIVSNQRRELIEEEILEDNNTTIAIPVEAIKFGEVERIPIENGFMPENKIIIRNNDGKGPMPSNAVVLHQQVCNEPQNKRNPRKRIRFEGHQIGPRIAEFALECRNNYRLKNDDLSQTQAHHYILTKMRERGMRESAISEQLPIAIAFALVPTESDILAKRLFECTEVQHLLNLMEERTKRFYRKPGDWIPWYHLVGMASSSR